MKLTGFIVVTLEIVLVLAWAWHKQKRAAKSTSQSTDDMMQFLVSEAVDIADKYYQTNLDFSRESIEKVEEVLGKIHEDYLTRTSEGGFQGLATAFGAYIGEVIRRAEPESKWERDHPAAGEKTYPLHWGGGDIFPCTWCYKRIVNGPEDNVWHKYLILKQQRDEKNAGSNAASP